jgi:mono/diheme cytochrome c family protein
MLSKLLKILGSVLLLLVVVASGAVAYIKLALPDVGPAPDLLIEPTADRVARGEYLAHHVSPCMDCHSTRDWSKFSGPLVPGTLGRGGEVFDQRFGFPGTFISRNITPAGVGAWSDGELYHAITAGVSRDGSALFNLMPYANYGRMDPEDVKAIIAYVRTLPAITNNVPAHEADFPVNILLNMFPQKATPTTRPAPTDVVAYGGYLVNAAGCGECHTKSERGKKVGLPFAGGFEFHLGDGNIVRSANITPHETGIKALTREAFLARFKAFADPAAVPVVDMAKGEMQTVMPWTMFAGMTEQDLGAIYEYLRTVPAVENVVERWTAGHK